MTPFPTLIPNPHSRWAMDSRSGMFDQGGGGDAVYCGSVASSTALALGSRLSPMSNFATYLQPVKTSSLSLVTADC